MNRRWGPACLAAASLGALGGTPTPVATAAAPAPAAAVTPASTASPPRLPSTSANPAPHPAAPGAERVELSPSPAGWLGAWLVVGPYRGGDAGPDEASPDPVAGASMGPAYLSRAAAARRGVSAASLGDPPRWTIVSSGEGPIDLRAALHTSDGDVHAYAAGVLHLEADSSLLLLLGVDDGVRIQVDGKEVFAREESRPPRDDDDVVPLELAKGDHTILLRLHQRDGSWALHARVLDARTLRPPEGAYLALPGTTAADARALSGKMSWVSVDRGLGPDGYRPKLTVRFPEGVPRGVPLPVRVRLVQGAVSAARPPFDTTLPSLFDLSPGEVPPGEGGGAELVATLPRLGTPDAPLDDGELTYEVGVAERRVLAHFSPRRAIVRALERASAAMAMTPAGASFLAAGSLESVRHLYDRVVSFGSHSDGDVEAELEEAKELEGLASTMARGSDPYAGRTGPMRRAYLSPIDGELAEFGLYVPPSYRAGNKSRRYPLVVGLHGLNGRPMAMVRYLFGFDDPKKENEWEDRHVGPLPPLEAFVVTPHGHGNTMYRDQGEDDVMRVLEWALATYPIDPDRVTITGMSMGGIGSAAVAFRHPDRFAAVEPLCGYHSYFVRRDIAGHPLRPWEKVLAEERSNVFWSDNGKDLPLYVVHGTLDQPEENSGVLIKRYEELGYSVEHEHPALGHNVWQTTYEDLKGIDWLLPHKRKAHPTDVRFRTVRLRDAKDAWVEVQELAAPDGWGDVTARIRPQGSVRLTTRGVSSIRLERDPVLTDPEGPLTVSIDGSSLRFDANEPAEMHKTRDGWERGPATHAGNYKHGEVTGPLRDAYHAPLLFVYGASDPAQARANEEVARAWALENSGIAVHYPVMSDRDFVAAGQPLANDHALFLVGNARSNVVVRALEPELPLRIEGDSVVLMGERFSGREAGAAFVYPNPRRPDRYLVVVEGVDATGTWRSLSLPSLLPDFVVYDVGVAASRGQMLLGAGSVRAGGFFGNDWSVPPSHGDPLAKERRAGAKNEYDATPYLP